MWCHAYVSYGCEILSHTLRKEIWIEDVWERSRSNKKTEIYVKMGFIVYTYPYY